MDTPRTRKPPRRVIQAMFEAPEGYRDPKLLTVFETECHGYPDCRLSQVIEGPIQFFALGEHHALPLFGHAYVGYIAPGRSDHHAPATAARQYGAFLGLASVLV